MSSNERMPTCVCGHGWPMHVIPGGVENIDIYPTERHCVDCACRNYRASDPPQGVTPQSEILAWLNIEQRKAERWAFSPHGVYRFAMTGPELMRIRHALGAVASEWQCRFVAEDARCCQLAKEHDGDHRFVTEENSCL